MSTTEIDLGRIRVGDVMSPGIVSCPPESSARAVASTMATKGLHCVVVADMLEEEGGVRGWGVISDLDLATVAGGEVDEFTAAEIAATEPLMVKTTDSLKHASQQMVDHQVAHVLVVEGEPARPVGVLSTLDLARALAGTAQPPPLVDTTASLEHLSEFAWALVDPLNLHKAEHRRWSAALHADYGYGPPFDSTEGLRQHLESASEAVELRPDDVPLTLIALLIAFFAAHPERHEAGRRLLADALREAFAGRQDMQKHDQVSDYGGGEPMPTLVPHASRFFARPATHAGHWAAWMSLTAFAALVAFNVLTEASERQDSGTVYDVMQVTRLILIAFFAASGLGALALSLRSLMRSERSIIVWAALAIGLFATTLIIGEFTFLE